MGVQLNCYEKYLTQVRRPTKVRCLDASKQPVGPTNTSVYRKYVTFFAILGVFAT